MLIVSPFHDYYDRAMSYGIDKTVVYRRVTKIVEMRDLDWQISLPHSSNWNRAGTTCVRPFLLGLCGEVHAGLRIGDHWTKPEWRVDGESWYSSASFLEHLRHEGRPVTNKYEKPWRGGREWLQYGYSKSAAYSEPAIERFFERRWPAEPTWSWMQHIWHTYKTPVWIIYDRFLVVNPRLADWDVGKLSNAPAVFQDIYMYISGVLGVTTRPMIEVSDEVKAASRGHDGKYSFRKPPGKRGNPRWR